MRYHLLAIGIHETLDWRRPALEAIQAIHQQGGVAIAAHPTTQYWPAFDAAALRILDGAEVAHPLAFAHEDQGAELRAFSSRASLAAIGDSDYHGLGPVGLCRTYIFARDDSEQAILDAIRRHRTVVYSGARVFGDPELIRLAGQQLPIPAAVPAPHPIVNVCAVIGLLLLVAARFA